MSATNLPTSFSPSEALETAGAAADPRVPVVDLRSTIADVEKILLQKARHYHSLHYIYVLDGNHKVCGVLSVREVFGQPKNTPVSAVMNKDVLTVRNNVDAESAALMALQKEVTAIPVVNAHGTFLGAITGDAVMRLLHEELTEDLFRISGVSNTEGLRRHWDNVETLSILTSLKHRLPWLLLGLLGGILAARIIDSFAGVLEQNIILAAYIPLIVYMADAVGTQMEAFIIRDFALRPDLKFSKYFLHQLSVVVVMAVLLSAIFVMVGGMLYGNLRLAAVIGLSLGAAIISSMVSGLLIPFLFGKMKLDPANASGPIATILQDILSVTVYFSIASWML